MLETNEKQKDSAKNKRYKEEPNGILALKNTIIGFNQMGRNRGISKLKDKTIKITQI